MSYNWVSASTPQGRDRLKYLIDQGHEIATRRTSEGRYKHVITHSGLNQHSGDIVIDNDIYEDWEDVYKNDTFWDLQFLDPSPSPGPVADENGLLPCPFCGGKAELKYDQITEWEVMIGVGCNDCQLGFNQLSNAVDKVTDSAIIKYQWNTRAGKETNP